MPGNTRFRARANLPGLPEGSERAIIESFRQVEAALADVQVVQRNATPVLNTASYMAKAGELVLLEGRAGGTLITIPPGSPANIEQKIRVGLVRGVLSPGVTISIIGRRGTINGNQTVVMTARGMVELTSVGEDGWLAIDAGGGGGGEDWAATLVLGNASGGTDVNLTGGSELQMAGDPGVAGEVLTSQGPGLEPVWAAAGGAPSWSAVLAVGNISGANSPSINSGQGLSFAGGALAGGDIRGATALTMVATTGSAVMSSTAGLAAVAGQTAAQVQTTAGSVTLQAGGANSVISRTNGTTRLAIDGTGAWLLAGAAGTSGQVLTSQGAGTPPIWAAAAGGGTDPRIFAWFGV